MIHGVPRVIHQLVFDLKHVIRKLDVLWLIPPESAHNSAETPCIIHSAVLRLKAKGEKSDSYRHAAVLTLLHRRLESKVCS